MDGLVKETIEELRPSLPSAVAVRIAAEDPAMLGDADRMRQVLTHLCQNAVQAMEEKGGMLDVALSTVNLSGEESIDVEKPGAYVKLTVSDTGCGMGPDVLDRVFDPFFSTRTSATGLGLSVVWGIVRQHGGSIAVESAPGEGTVFTVLLPALSEPPAAKEKTKAGASKVIP